MKEIDVRGLSCPEPVLMLKEALEANRMIHIRYLPMRLIQLKI